MPSTQTIFSQYQPNKLRTSLILSAIYTILSIVFYSLISQSDFSLRLSNTIYDNFSVTNLRAPSEDILIIAIDDKSLAELRTWPWPRNYHASMIDYLTDAKAKAIALNIIFTEPTENDPFLAESISENNNVVLPIYPISSKLDINNDPDIGKQNIFYQMAKLGHVVINTDLDGMLRSAELWGGFNEYIYPSFALKLLQLTDPEKAVVYEKPQPIHDFRWHTSKPVLIQFSGTAGTINSVSYSDVLAGRIPIETFHDKIIFIGTKAAGLGDNYIPAIAGNYQQMSGVEIQAQIYDALRLQKINTIYPPAIIHITAITFIILTVLIIALCSPILGVGVGIISILIQIILSFLLFVLKEKWMPLTDGILTITFFTVMHSSLATHLRLKEANRSLEVRVAERTQELTVANYTLEQEVGERKSIELTLRDNELQLRIILDNLHVGVVMVDENGIILATNKTISSLFLVDALHLINQKLDQYFSYDASYGYAPFISQVIFQQLNNSSDIHIELEAKRGNETFPVDLGFSRLIQQGKVRYVCLIRDITLQKHSEILTQEFVATVSHELRTPLTSIKGSLSLISNITSIHLPEKIKALLNIALRNSDRLLMLVNDILDIQKIQLGTLNFNLRETDLVDIIMQSIEVNESYATPLQINFVFRKPDTPVWIMGDPDRLIQVMTNLLSNAVKFSPTGSVVDIVLEHNRTTATVKVIDYGYGIPENFKSRIFQKFAQANDATHRSKGTGLGLSITKALVERMGGEINFESEEDKGSLFYFTFPTIPNSKKFNI